MKYFDREFMTGCLTDEECDKRIQTYGNHIREILNNANYKIRMLAEAISLHDAKILEINGLGKKNECRILIGDNQKGHAQVLLTFFSSKNLESIPSKLPFEIVYYELDYDDEYTLSCISGDFKEFAIRFTDISIVFE